MDNTQNNNDEGEYAVYWYDFINEDNFHGKCVDLYTVYSDIFDWEN